MNSKQRNMHFKSAHISAADLSPEDMEMINAYALAPLKPEDIFAFKVSMAANEIDRDHEVFPIETLQKFANLFVGRTVVKDHDHRSDNQIARIYATNLVEGDIMHLTRTNEVYTELIAKCYMVKTSTNAGLIAEIQAGIRKEVSLGCRIGKAVCSVCGTDNVKRYCEHFPGREYKGETCYFSLEDPTDAYELSFVAIPAQQHAGTVKSYGEKPCCQSELRADDQGKRLTVNQAGEPDGGDDRESDALTWAVDGLAERLDALSEKLAGVEAAVELLIAKEADSPPDEPQEPPASAEAGQAEKRLTVNRVEDIGSAEAADGKGAQGNVALVPKQDAGADEQKKRLTVNQVQEGSASCPTESDQGESGQDPAPVAAQVEETESQEELKAKQAMARLRALELALSIRSNMQDTTQHRKKVDMT